jgi:hypothetical protein
MFSFESEDPTRGWMSFPTRPGAARKLVGPFSKPFVWHLLAVSWTAIASTSAEDLGNEFALGVARQQRPTPAAIEEARAELRQASVTAEYITTNLPQLVEENQSQPARVYAIMSIAAEEFLGHKQFDRALDCYKDLSQRFEVGLSDVALEAFTTAHENVKRFKVIEKREASEALFLAVGELIKELMAQGNYGEAENACQLFAAIQQTARSAKTRRAGEFGRSVEVAQARVRSGKQAFKMMEAARTRLQVDGQDQNALETLGLYACLYANDWRTGLDYLGKLQPGTLRTAAKADTNASTFLGLSGEDAYAVAKKWKQVASDDRIFGAESLWLAAQDAVLQRELEWLERAILLDIANGIDRKLAWGRQNQLQEELGVDPHAIVGTWRVLTNEPAWKKTFLANGQLIANHPQLGKVEGTWQPEGSGRVVVVTEHNWKWQCTIEDGGKQLLIEEFDPKGKKRHSVRHKQE